MKNWFNKNYKTLIITAFLIPIITVAVVSISHVTTWYGISNPITWSLYLSIGIEIAALSALAAISANMGSKVYFPFIIVTIVQFVGNIFFAYSFINIDSKSFLDWVDLVDPLVQFMGVESGDLVGHKRFLALFSGGMLPVISLSFLHMLVKFTEEDRKKQNSIIEDIPNPDDKINASDLIGEVSRVRLSDKDLEILEKHLLNPEEPNEKLKDASKKYNERVKEESHIAEKLKQREVLTEMMNNDQELGLYDLKHWREIKEPFDNPLVMEPSTPPQNVSEMMLTTNSNIIDSIPSDDEISDWDVTLMDGLEEEVPFFTEEEMMNFFQEETFMEEKNNENYDTFIDWDAIENLESEHDYLIGEINEEDLKSINENVITPSLSDEEINKMVIDEWERNFDLDEDDETVWTEEMEKEYWENQVPEPFATPEEVIKYGIDTPIITENIEDDNPIIENDEEKKKLDFRPIRSSRPPLKHGRYSILTFGGTPRFDNK